MLLFTWPRILPSDSLFCPFEVWLRALGGLPSLAQVLRPQPWDQLSPLCSVYCGVVLRGPGLGAGRARCCWAVSVPRCSRTGTHVYVCEFPHTHVYVCLSTGSPHGFPGCRHSGSCGCAMCGAPSSTGLAPLSSTCYTLTCSVTDLLCSV